MPQIQLPLFPSRATGIHESLGFECREEQVVYINGRLPVFTPVKEDVESGAPAPAGPATNFYERDSGSFLFTGLAPDCPQKNLSRTSANRHLGSCLFHLNLDCHSLRRRADLATRIF